MCEPVYMKHKDYGWLVCNNFFEHQPSYEVITDEKLIEECEEKELQKKAWLEERDNYYKQHPPLILASWASGGEETMEEFEERLKLNYGIRSILDDDADLDEIL